jgi:16S rRNA (cytidine1402-2'-O)-methyltransferase
VPLLVASTPIGNVADASPRLREALADADVIAAEDTRRLRRLLTALEVEPRARVVSNFDHNEAARVDELIAEVQAGHSVVVVTDAGTPLVSDPGYRIVAAAAAAGLPVQVVPGPSAVTAALAVSGLPVDRWCFEGFPPRKAGERRRAFAALASEPRTLVFFEAPHRIGATLRDLAEAFGPDRLAVVCRELTKTYEEVRRASLAELAEWAHGEVRGEVTLVVAGAVAAVAAVGDEQLIAAVQQHLSAGASTRDAATEVADRFGVPRRRVYALAHDRGDPAKSSSPKTHRPTSLG